MSRPPVTAETAAQKVRMAEDGWNSRTRPQVWHLCFTRLHARPDWLESWLIGWGLLLAWGGFAFLVVPAAVAVPAQATFFAGLFPWILLPVAKAAVRGGCGSSKA